MGGTRHIRRAAVTGAHTTHDASQHHKQRTRNRRQVEQPRISRTVAPEDTRGATKENQRGSDITSRQLRQAAPVRGG